MLLIFARCYLRYARQDNRSIYVLPVSQTTINKIKNLSLQSLIGKCCNIYEQFSYDRINNNDQLATKEKIYSAAIKTYSSEYLMAYILWRL